MHILIISKLHLSCSKLTKKQQQQQQPLTEKCSCNIYCKRFAENIKPIFQCTPFGLELNYFWHHARNHDGVNHKIMATV